MAIHVTPIPRLTTLVAPAFSLGVANAAGSAITSIASDSTILTYDTTDPASVGTAATGSATTAARRDHVHSGVATDSLATAKAWAKWEQSGTHSLLASYNYTSVTDGGDTGETDHLVATDFSSANYVIVGTPVTQVNGAFVYVTSTPSQAAGGFTTVTREHDGTRIDTTNFVTCLGAQ